MSRANTARQHQDVDSLITKLARENPQGYRTLSTLMVKYKRKQITLVAVYREMHDLFQVNYHFLCFEWSQGI
jgi:hypothetical protein